MTESGNGTMTDFDAIHDRIREQVFEVSSELRERDGTEEPLAPNNNSQAVQEQEEDQDPKTRTDTFSDRLKESNIPTTGPARSKADPEEQSTQLAAHLYEIGRTYGVKQSFGGVNLDRLRRLRAKYEPEEIIAAWIEHLEGCSDEFDLRQAVNRFCRGGCETIIEARRQRAEREREAAEAEEKRKQAQEAAECQRRLHIELTNRISKVVRGQEDLAGREYLAWTENHERSEHFVPTDKDAFERYLAESEYQQAWDNRVPASERQELGKRISRLRGVAEARLSAPELIAAAEADLAQAIKKLPPQSDIIPASIGAAATARQSDANWPFD